MRNNADYAINMKLLKQFRFYEIFDPNGTKILGVNPYRFTNIACTTIVILTFVYGGFGYFMDLGDTTSVVDIFVFVGLFLEQYMMTWQSFVFIYYADIIWEIFDLARLNLLKSKGCTTNEVMMRNERVRSIWITNWYFVLAVLVSVQWMLFPLVKHWSEETDNLHRRNENIFNLRFTVNVQTYNKYYAGFYIIEIIIQIYDMYLYIIFDVFTISICRVITIQYKVLSRAFENIEQEDTENNYNEQFEQFKSILSDQRRLYLKLKSYYFVMKTIVLWRVALLSSIIIIVTFTFIVICTTTELSSYLSFIKFGCGIIYASYQLFIYCYLFDNINTARDSVNFGIYSCNWTMMDLKFKKLVLLAMRMNDATQLTFKVSPKKIINLQFFGSVINTSYNIVSVLVKTLKPKRSS